MNQLCKVCGEPAAGFHFGAFTCEGCKVCFSFSFLPLTTTIISTTTTTTTAEKRLSVALLIEKCHFFFSSRSKKRRRRRKKEKQLSSGRALGCAVPCIYSLLYLTATQICIQTAVHLIYLVVPYNSSPSLFIPPPSARLFHPPCFFF